VVHFLKKKMPKKGFGPGKEITELRRLRDEICVNVRHPLVCSERTQAKESSQTRGKKVEVIPVQAMMTYRGSRGIAPLILDLGTRWR
jgi:hypothetical protein